MFQVTTTMVSQVSHFHLTDMNVEKLKLCITTHKQNYQIFDRAYKGDTKMHSVLFKITFQQ